MFNKFADELKEDTTAEDLIEYDDQIYEENDESDKDDDCEENSHLTSGRSSQVAVTPDLDENSTESKSAQSVKRERSCVEKEVLAPKAKKRAVLQSFDEEDDDVIVLSD